MLVCGLLVVIQLFQSSLRYSARTEKRLVAALLAQRRMEELRLWARTPTASGFNYDNWAAMPSGSFATQPDYRVTVTPPTPHRVYSPSSALAPNRPMNQSLMKVAVQVSYPPYSSTDQVRLVSLIGDPQRQIASIAVTPTSPPLPAPIPLNTDVLFQAQAKDVEGNIVRDTFFQWCVALDGPVPGAGHLSLGPEIPTRQATFRNEVQRADGVYEVPPFPRGRCRVEARSRGRSSGVTAEVVGSIGLDL